MKKTILLTIFCVLISPVFAEIWYVDDYLAINDGEVYDGEIFVTGSGVVELFGGVAGKIETRDNSSAILRGGSVYWLDIKGNSIGEIYEGQIGEGALGLYDESIAYLYAYNVQFYQSDDFGQSQIEGTYYLSNEDFMIPVWDKEHFSKIQVVPEPTGILVLSVGVLFIRKQKIVKCQKGVLS